MKLKELNTEENKGPGKNIGPLVEGNWLVVKGDNIIARMELNKEYVFKEDGELNIYEKGSAGKSENYYKYNGEKLTITSGISRMSFDWEYEIDSNGILSMHTPKQKYTLWLKKQ